VPYPSERASRLGHVPTVNSQAVQDAFSRWDVAQAAPADQTYVTSLCRSIDELDNPSVADAVRFAITVDGSDTEVEATREHPTIKVGYVRVAASFIDFDKLGLAADGGNFVNPYLFLASHKHSTFDRALPGSGLVIPGSTGVDTWRQELDGFLQETRFDPESDQTLADMLLILHGSPAIPASTAPLRRCPSCGAHGVQLSSGQIDIPKTGAICPVCGARLYLGDVLRTEEEYVPEGSNRSALTRLMLVAERLTSIGYMQLLLQNRYYDLLKKILFITDGPLALHGTVAPLKTRFQDYLGKFAKSCASAACPAAPLVVGVEKSGAFVEHAQLIAHLIHPRHAMLLTTEYINRMTGRPLNNPYGSDEFYGRRFIYRTSSGGILVLTVPPKPDVLPYDNPNGECWASYPTLRPICEVLDRVQTRLYENAVIPVALAHSDASLPLGVGQSVLRALVQQSMGLPLQSQIRQTGPFIGSH